MGANNTTKIKESLDKLWCINSKENYSFLYMILKTVYQVKSHEIDLAYSKELNIINFVSFTLKVKEENRWWYNVR